MIIKVLSENICNSPLLKKEHGLSLYIESQGIKILFDFGAGPNFYFNANQLNLDLGDVEYAILSHGHSDHGGGLSTFMEKNKKAKVYLQKVALLPHYSLKADGPKDIGIDKNNLDPKRLHYVEERFSINENMEVFRAIKEYYSPFSKDKHLLTKDTKDRYIEDTFEHEINLALKEKEETFLFTGCAHRGIRNIMEEYKSLFASYPKHVIGGLHLSKLNLEDEKIVRDLNELTDYMEKTRACFYTGHCTGHIIYEYLKDKMKDKINYISTGTNIKI